ncbi:MAG TPA: hypothetical protein VM802_11135 [Chitinophaga sp.]|uniref:hypothetical protein n=1 Tax=Chitinophaga sp. TaxID=1869181 RepID=UPI002BA1FB65|nr:hypothetical protein [Chitinophaga sp.]HVI45420.1 hypothetical protein [Chitinophaga sp.]
MKLFLCLLLTSCVLLCACSSQKTGCPATNYYTKEAKQHNHRAGKQMSRLF